MCDFVFTLWTDVQSMVPCLASCSLHGFQKAYVALTRILEAVGDKCMIAEAKHTQ